MVEVNGHTIKGQINLRELFYTEANCADPENTFNVFKFVKLHIVRKLGARRLRKVFPVDRQEHLDALIHDLEVSQHRKNGGTGITAIEDDDDYGYGNDDDTECTDGEHNSDNSNNDKDGNTETDDDFVSESKFSEDDDHGEETKDSNDLTFPRLVRAPGDFRGDINLDMNLMKSRKHVTRTFYNVH